MRSHSGPHRRPPVSAVVTVGCAERPSSAMPRPNMACSRRRQPRFTTIFSFAVPWRFITARSAARLRRTVGPLASRKAVAGQSRQRDIIGNNRTYSEHIPGISGHFRAYSGHFRASSDTRGSSCAVSSVAGSHAVVSVAAGMARRLIACDQARCVRYRSVPGTASRRGVACDTARRGEWASRAVSPLAGSCAVWPVAHSRLVTSRPTSATSRLCRAYGRASGTPVICHAPAQHTPVADAANRCVANIFSLVRRGASGMPVRRRG